MACRPWSEALDDVRRVAGLRRRRGLLDRAEARRGVVVGDQEQAGRHADADERAQVQVADAGVRAARDAVHQPLGDRVEGDRRDDAGEDQALVERALDVARRRLHGEGADDRGDDRHAAEHERVQRDRGRGLLEGQDAEQHHGDRGDRVGLEQVGGHAGAVADVVAHVVGDHGRVARVVLGDAGLDLADEVGADVGGLGEDAAAQSGEDRDQRAAEAQADERVHGLLLAAVEDGRQQAVVAGHAEQREAHHEQAGDGAAAEGDVERGADAAAGGLGHAGVGAHRHVHADVAGGAREDAADHEADGDVAVLDEDQGDGQDDAHGGDDRVLAVQVGARALLDGAGDALHLGVARREGEQRAGSQQAVGHGEARADERDDDPVVGQELTQGSEVLRRCDRVRVTALLRHADA